ncbi:GNAT family N-acetyltransferase [Halorientalis halophila]|uniref:GNAT family N-acetyltransferase n=1 Tax=Halorientalis halophila TaxID=3108499 RepID=UPI0030087F54
MKNPLVRVTRSEHAQRAYDALAELGITAAKMDQYVRDLDAVPEPTAPAGVELDCQRAGDLDRTEADTFVEPAPIDRVVTARDGDDLLGYLFVSHNRPVYVEALDAERLFDGAYLWRLYVDPDARNRGIATALVTRGLREAASQGAERASALVAMDNTPSKRVFAANGFEPNERVNYYRLFGFERRSSREL